MVQEACTFVEQTPSLEIKLGLIEALRVITEGKIFVENERARLTKTLVDIREKEGNIPEAATLLQALQVETYGTMEKREKVMFILEQMRLSIANEDFVRTQIISKKISHKYFSEAGTYDQKLKFFQLMIQLHQHDLSYINVCKDYRSLADSPDAIEDVESMNMFLKNQVLFVILAPYDNEQWDLLQRLKVEKSFERVSKYQELLTLFTTMELINWHVFCDKYEAYLKKGNGAEDPPADAFTEKFPHGETNWKNLRTRIIQHNMRVIAMYYSKITMPRLAQLLDLSYDETETFLSELVVNGTVSAKIDRLAKEVSFGATKSAVDILNDWSGSLDQLMNLVDKTTHLISKEEMVHRIK